MTDGEGVAAEVHGIEAVIHDQLGAERIVDAWAEYERLGRQEAPQAPARVLVARRGGFEALREEGSRNQLHRSATRFRGRSCTGPGIRTPGGWVGPTFQAPATDRSFPCSATYQAGLYKSN